MSVRARGSTGRPDGACRAGGTSEWTGGARWPRGPAQWTRRAGGASVSLRSRCSRRSSGTRDSGGAGRPRPPCRAYRPVCPVSSRRAGGARRARAPKSSWARRACGSARWASRTGRPHGPRWPARWSSRACISLGACGPARWSGGARGTVVPRISPWPRRSRGTGAPDSSWACGTRRAVVPSCASGTSWPDSPSRPRWSSGSRRAVVPHSTHGSSGPRWTRRTGGSPRWTSRTCCPRWARGTARRARGAGLSSGARRTAGGAGGALRACWPSAPVAATAALLINVILRRRFFRKYWNVA